MAKFELKLPQMGESVAEATLTAWLKDVGDTIEMDEAVFEIATDKVDSEVPSEVEGVLLEKLFDIDDVIKVGQTVAVIEQEGGSEPSGTGRENQIEEIIEEVPEEAETLEKSVTQVQELVGSTAQSVADTSRFYSPLVKNIAREEGITRAELDSITGTGNEGRVTKNDILNYIKNGKTQSTPEVKPIIKEAKTPEPIKQEARVPAEPHQITRVPSNGEDEIIPMTRMGRKFPV